MRPRDFVASKSFCALCSLLLLSSLLFVYWEEASSRLCVSRERADRFPLLTRLGTAICEPNAEFHRCYPTDGLISRFVGGVPGFYSFENVWYRNDTIYFYNQNAARDFPIAKGLVSGRTQVQMVVQDPPMRSIPNTCFRGNNLWLNEGWHTGWHALWHYYHFAAENILAGFAAFAFAAGSNWRPDLTFKRILIPLEAGWRDKYGLNELLVNGIFGAENMVDTARWKTLMPGEDDWAFFEKVTFVDRWGSHALSPEAQVWNKMALPLLEKDLPAHFFEPTRKAMLKSIGVPTTSSTSKLVYVDRQNSSRTLVSEDHDAMLGTLDRLGGELGFEFVHAKLEEMAIEEQIATIADAKVLLGVHGNGLTHAMWMQGDFTVIELFPPEVFLRDYETVTTALGGRHVAVRNDTILTEAAWRADPGEKGAQRLHDWRPIPVQASLVAGVVSDAFGVPLFDPRANIQKRRTRYGNEAVISNRVRTRW